MKLKDKFLETLEFDNSKDRVEHESKMLMFKFLSVIESEMDKQNMTKKELANCIGTSPSYITQLFRGTKIINLQKIIELQNLFNLDFEISAKRKSKKTKSAKPSKSKRGKDKKVYSSKRTLVKL